MGPRLASGKKTRGPRNPTRRATPPRTPPHFSPVWTGPPLRPVSGQRAGRSRRSAPEVRAEPKQKATRNDPGLSGDMCEKNRRAREDNSPLPMKNPSRATRGGSSRVFNRGHTCPRGAGLCWPPTCGPLTHLRSGARGSRGLRQPPSLPPGGPDPPQSSRPTLASTPGSPSPQSRCFGAGWRWGFAEFPSARR